MSKDGSTERFFGMNGDLETNPQNLAATLTQMANAYRIDIAKCWSRKTARPSLQDQDNVGRFKSKGQCSPTARLFLDQIRSNFPNLEANLIRGAVNFRNQETKGEIEDHIWIEVTLDEKSSPIVIDLTPDQIFASETTDLPNINIDSKAALKAKGWEYQSKSTDTDVQMMLSESKSFERYEALKRKYERFQRRKKFFDQLFHQNIFIIGPVASGKTTLLGNLEKLLPQKSIDVGLLFRFCSYILLQNEDVKDLLASESFSDSQLEQKIYRLTRSLSAALSNFDIVRSQTDSVSLVYQANPLEASLQSDEINRIVAHVARNPAIRNMVWQWIKKQSAKQQGIIITGHSLKDIDPTNYAVIQLQVDPVISSERSLNRGSQQDASARDNEDRWSHTQNTLSKVWGNLGAIESNSDPRNVAFTSVKHLIRTARARERSAQSNQDRIERNQFHWQINPLLTQIRTKAETIFQKIALERKSQNAPAITEFDLAVQTIIVASSYPATDIWLGKPDVVNSVADNCATDSIDAETEQLFLSLLDSQDITLNKELIEKIARSQIDRLLTIYQSSTVNGKELPYMIMNDPEKSPFQSQSLLAPELTKSESRYEQLPDGERIQIVKEKTTGREVHIKRVDTQVSRAYGKGFHYLHSERSDELLSYGVFLPNETFPFAWVSYSLVDRSYKKDLLHSHHIEPHRVVEMTRAWNCVWSPKNTMSMLFAFAHDEIYQKSVQLAKEGKIDKPFAGVITAINPNLGFRANAFNGVGFTTIGKKPANFTFDRNEGEVPVYTPRRALVQKYGLQSTADIATDPKCGRNAFPLLATNEMYVSFDPAQFDTMQAPIFKIPDSAYERN